MAAPRKQISTRRRFEILKRDGFRCRYCGRTAAQIDLHIDHVHPVSRGGSDDPDNLVTACADCNLGKADIPLNAPAPASRGTCEICHARPVTHVHLVPYASPPCVAVLACPACDPGGYHIALSEWDDPAGGLDWRRHLAETKNGGHELVALVEEAVCR